MEFYCILKFNKDIKVLRKKYPSTERDISNLKNIFEAKGELPGVIKYPGVGDEYCHKAKIVCVSMGAGKRKGFRLIFRKLGNKIIFIHLYTHGQYSKEIDVVNEVRERLKYSREDLTPF